MWCNARRQQRQPKHSFAWLEFLLSLSAKFRYNLDVCARTCANDNVSNWCFFFGNFVVAHVSMSALTSDQISCTQIKSIGFFCTAQNISHFRIVQILNFLVHLFICRSLGWLPNRFVWISLEKHSHWSDVIALFGLKFVYVIKMLFGSIIKHFLLSILQLNKPWAARCYTADTKHTETHTEIRLIFFL